MSSSSVELVPCVKCGSHEIICVFKLHDDKHIFCKKCGNITSEKRSTWALAKKLWNRENKEEK